MAQLGGLLVVLGLGSIVLPLFDLQFRILDPLDPYQPWAGIVLALIGAAILALPMIRARSAGGGPGPTGPAS